MRLRTRCGALSPLGQKATKTARNHVSTSTVLTAVPAGVEMSRKPPWNGRPFLTVLRLVTHASYVVSKTAGKFGNNLGPPVFPGWCPRCSLGSNSPNKA